MPKVLITNGQLRKSLAAVRSLGRKGIQTYVVEETRFTPTAFSKYCMHSMICPSPSKTPELFYKKICEIIKKYEIDVFLPMDEDTVQSAMAHKDELLKLCRMALPPLESYNITSDKGEGYKHAFKNGVIHPKTVFPENENEVDELCKDLIYPLVVKPRRSNGGRGICFVNGRDELLPAYRKVHRDYSNPIIQESVGEGTIFDVALLYNNKGELRASFIQRNVRKFPLKTGPSSVLESIVSPELLGLALDYMKGLPWCGPADLEFMVQKDTGKIFFIELNAKLWNSIQVGVFCGVDFPWLIYKIATEGDCETVRDYRAGLMCRNLLPSDALNYLANTDKKSMNPPFWDFKKYDMPDDIAEKGDMVPVLGFFLACCRYLFSWRMWKFLLRL